MTEITHPNRPRPILLFAALASPFLIFGLAVLLVRQFQNRPGQGYTVVGIILIGELVAVMAAVGCAICAWKRGERPAWLGVIGIVVSLYMLKRLLFAS